MNNFTEHSYIRNLKHKAENNHVPAIYMLGVAYEEGRYVSIDLDESMYWYEKAANLGDIHSQLSLSTVLRKESAYEEMFEWLERAAIKENTTAQYRVGYCFELGLGVIENYDNARYWYQKAALKGDRDAQFRLGLMYHRRICKCNDEHDALNCFRKAASQGHLGALSFLGDYYETGKVVSQDYTRAAEYYRKAAEGGFPAAQYCLGQMLQIGMGVEKSEEEGAWWISEAANKGFVPAVYLRSLLNVQGVGIPKNTTEACKWFLIAQRLDVGNSPAMDIMSELIETECSNNALEHEWKEGERLAEAWLERFVEADDIEKQIFGDS